MIIDLLSSALGGFSPSSRLLNRALDGLWSTTRVVFVNFNYPLTSVIFNRSLSSEVQARTLTTEMDQ